MDSADPWQWELVGDAPRARLTYSEIARRDCPNPHPAFLRSTERFDTVHEAATPPASTSSVSSIGSSSSSPWTYPASPSSLEDTEKTPAARLGNATMAALGLDMRDTGRGCGLAVIQAFDVVVEPRVKSKHRWTNGGNRSSWNKRGSKNRSVTAITQNPQGFDRAVMSWPPHRMRDYSPSGRRGGWWYTLSEVWKRERDRRFPQRISPQAMGYLAPTLMRPWWTYGGNLGHSFHDLLFGTLEVTAEIMDCRLWHEMATAVSYVVADAFVKNAHSYESPSSPRVYCWDRNRRLLRHPTKRLEEALERNPSNVQFFGFQGLEWLFGHANPQHHVRHTPTLDVPLLIRGLELEVRARRLRKQALETGTLTPQWTPYGLVGTSPHGIRVPASFIGEYLAEPLPETRLICYALATVDCPALGHHCGIRRYFSSIEDASAAWGLEFWHDVAQGAAYRRYEAIIYPGGVGD